MSKSLDEVLEALPPQRRQRIAERGQELVRHQLTLRALRKELGLTQEAMAILLETRQTNVSKLEKRADMLISTLRGYVEAMGGSLELVARLPGKGVVTLEGIGDLRAEDSR